MRIGLAFTPFLPYPDNLPFSIWRMFIRFWKWRTNLSGKQYSEPRHVWTACPGRIRKDICERKAYPHKVCPDRNRIRLCVNKIRSLSRHMWMAQITQSAIVITRSMFDLKFYLNYFFSYNYNFSGSESYLRTKEFFQSQSRPNYSENCI